MGLKNRKGGQFDCKKHSGGAGWTVYKVEFNDTKTVAKIEPSGILSGLDKYIGIYSFLSNKYVLNKFPVNSVVHTLSGDKYLPLDKKYIGKYFLVEDFGFYRDTTKIVNYAHGFIAPQQGVIIAAVDEKTGAVSIQNFNSFGKTTGPTMDYNNDVGNPNWAKFTQRPDGHYDLIFNNAKWTWSAIK